MNENIIHRFNRLKQVLKEANEIFTDLSNEIRYLKETQASSLQAIAEQLGYLKVDQQLFKDFFNKPYVILPRKEGEWYLITPRFIDLQLGWLYQQTESYNVFIVNRYIDWLYRLPPEIKQELGFKEPPFKPLIEDDFLICKPEETDLAWQRYKRYLTRREAPGKIRIKRKSHFWLVCELIKDGILPFKPKPVEPADLLDRYPSFELKPYQKEAWTYFTRFGNIGVYWPPGVGKMFFAIYAMTRLKGKKLVIVPTVTLVEEWTRKIKALTPLNSWEYEVICYASAHKVMKKDYVLTVFDECLRGDTKILMSDGTERQIKNLMVGDIVLSYNFKEKKLEPKPITRLFKTYTYDLLKIEAEGKTLFVTPEHKLFTDKGLKKANNLKIRDKLFIFNTYQQPKRDKPYAKMPNMQKLFPTGNIHLKTVVIEKVERFNNYPRSEEGKEELSFPKNEQRQQHQVLDADRAIRKASSLDEKQTPIKVYDIEVKDNHNFFANGILSSNSQHLPANTYARLALIKTKYRIGTTATPWREDGRIDLIFALTGFPLGLSWEEFLRMRVIAKPYIELIIVSNITQKFSVLDELIREHPDKTMIFCDSLDLGKRISSKYSIPFVYGATSRRLQIIEKSPLTVVSRVGDEGIDITDLKTIIEFDFLFGSRRQEAQRMGRLLHSRFKGEHYILMTTEEFERYKKRLYSLYERGFQIKITRRD